jgi:hypothetical protein
LVKLSNLYYIDADNYNWILYKKSKSKKTNEDVYTGVKFYPSLESLLSNYLDMNLRLENIPTTDLKDLAMMLYQQREKTSNSLYRICKDITKEMVKNE